jgi:FkbM family methyltransferase
MNVLQSAVISAYGYCRRLGLMRYRPIQNAFSAAYFQYKRMWEDPFAELMRLHPHLFMRGHILDVGANIGYTTVLFAQAAGRSGKVISFEPDEQNFALLTLNLRKRGLEQNVEPVRGAVGEKNGDAELWINPKHPADHRVITPTLSRQLQPTAARQPVSLWSLDEYLGEKHPGEPVCFVKVDVQGYEESVCRGMDETLRQNPQAVVALEYFPQGLRASGFEPENLLKFFRDRNYQAQLLRRGAPLRQIRYEDISRSIPADGYADLVFSQRSLC